MLVVVGLYVHMDRLVIGLQGEVIRGDLGLGDFEFGLVQGLSVALFSTVIGYPVGWLADRFDPRRVLAVCLLFWSLGLALCGLASGFSTLFAASALVGAAEAGLLPIAYALIPAWFPGPRRRQANMLFVFLGRLSVGLVIAFCGWMIRGIDVWREALPSAWAALPTWRLSMLVTGAAGLVLVALILRLPRPDREGGGAVTGTAPAPARAWRFLREHARVLAPLYLAAGLCSLAASAVGTFVPLLAQRAWGLDAAAAGSGMGLAALSGALAALVGSGFAVRRVEARGGRDAPLRVAGASLALGALSTPWLAMVSWPTAFFTVYALHLCGVMAAVMLLPTVLGSLAPPTLRARAMSLYVAANVVIGAAGPALVGALSDAAAGTARALCGSMAGVGFAGLLAAALLLWQASLAIRPGPGRGLTGG